MSQSQVQKVKQGYTLLSASEKQDFKKFIEDYDKASEFDKKRIEQREEFKSLGPLASSGCPCCGKS
jgi:hypothetical protein